MVRFVNRATAADASPSRAATSLRLLLVAALLLPLLLALAGRADASIYYTNDTDGRVARAANDGTVVTDAFFTATGKPGALTLSSSSLFMANDTAAGAGGINFTGFLGGAPYPHVTGLSNPQGMARDASNMYWVEAGGVNRIGRTGSGPVVKDFITTGITDPGGLAAGGGYIYWSNTSTGTIGRAKADGTDINPSFITGTAKASGLALTADHLYWANENGTAGTTIGRANVDGTGVNQSFITGATRPHALAVDDAYLYWTNRGGSTIGRAKLDGTGVNQSFVAAGVTAPLGIAVDASRATKTSVACTPSTIMAYRPISCTVTVQDVGSGTKVVPSGEVSMSGGAAGGLFSPYRCMLENPTADSASCTVTYTPYTASTTTVTASFLALDGTGLAQSRATTSVVVQPAPPGGGTTTDLSCTLTTVPMESPTVCTVTVTDTGATPESPLGTVSISRTTPYGNPYGVFVPSFEGSPSSGRCALAAVSATASSCSVTYRSGQPKPEVVRAAFSAVTGRWSASSDTEALTILPALPHPTSTTVACTPDLLQATIAAACVVTVEDLDPLYSRFPTGGVQAESDAAGTLAPHAGYCSLNPDGLATSDPPRGARSSCRVRYTPSYGGEPTLKVTYGGGAGHIGSVAQQTLDVDGPPPPVVDPPSGGGGTPGGGGPSVVPGPVVVVPPPSILPLAKPAVTPFALAKITSKQQAAFAKSGKLTLVVTVPAAGKISGKATAKIGRKTVTVGSIKASAKAGGKQSVKLSLSSKARAALRKSGRLKVSIEVGFGSARKTASVTLKAAKKQSTSKKASR